MFKKFLIVLLLVLAPLALILYKQTVLGYSLEDVIPWRAYHVRLDMSFDSHGDSLQVSTFLPASSRRQHIWDETPGNSALEWEVSTDAWGNRNLNLRTLGQAGTYKVPVAFRVLPEHVRYDMDPDLELSDATAGTLLSELMASEKIQSGHPEIDSLARRLRRERTHTVPLLKSAFGYVSDSMSYVNFQGSTDALTALRLGEASCNGKSRLMAAILRNWGIPARVVGGFILEAGEKRTSHQWVEAHVNGFWVPFCPTNGYFAEIPAHYLTLYRGDHALFRHTPNINFDYRFHVSTITATKPELGLQDEDVASIFRIWSVFQEVGLDLGILKLLLLLPVGGLITVFFRNIVGMEPFGTFLPALLAAAFHQTGLGWGLAAFFFVIALCSLVRFLLDQLDITHTPKLAIIMTAVVAAMLSMTLVGLKLDVPRLAFVSFFPIVVLTMTVERFSRTITEEGWAIAVRRTLATGVAISSCFFFMEIKVLQLFLMTFPEALLFLVAINIWVGRWRGVRLVEYWRFRHLLLSKRPVEPAV